MVEVEHQVPVEKTTKPIARVLVGIIVFLGGLWVFIDYCHDVPEPKANKMVFTLKK